ncbi:hypothetical protein TNCV_2096041 [Trichonephila clavipes]|nr:hypothetical protein TNCV_2096041 [Trichonephila clavipes]
MTPPPQDTLVSRKLMTGYARDFTGRECTEMSFANYACGIALVRRAGVEPATYGSNNITKIAARAEESRQLARVHTLRAQDKDRRR